MISVGYLALTPQAVQSLAPDTVWTPFTRFFPWEDWRRGRPSLIDEVIAPGLGGWAATDERRARVRLLFALGGAPWNEERVLERYELLYEAGLAPEAGRDRERARGRAGSEFIRAIRMQSSDGWERHGCTEVSRTEACIRSPVTVGGAASLRDLRLANVKRR